MVIDDTTYQLPKRWYRAVWLFLTACNLWFVGAFVVIQYFFPHVDMVATFGINLNILVIASIGLAYLIASYWLMFSSNHSLASFIGAMLTIFVVYIAAIDGLEFSIATVIYCLLWGIMLWVIGIYGSTVSIGLALVGIMAQLVNKNFMFNDIPLIFWIFLAITMAAVIYSIMFWRTKLLSTHDTELDKLSSMLQSNRQQSQILIQSINDGIVVTDTAGKVTLMNPAASLMTQWSISEAAGVDARLVVKLNTEDGAEVSDADDPFTLVYTQQKHSVQILQLEGREGNKITISFSISPILMPNDPKPRGAVAVMRDISEDREAEKQRGEFISTASHEMRTPVAAIEGYLALALSDKVSTIDSRARGYLEKAHASTQHLGKLFQDLLTSSKAEDGRLSNHPSVVEMGAFLQQLTDDLKFAAEKKGLTVDFVIGGADETIDATTKDASTQHLVKPLYYVNVDPERMREVITNLFDNACKYTDAGKVSIGLTGNNEIVQLYIRDTGAGIPADDIPHLFQKFYRVDSSATRTIGGTGLGLFICRKIVEMYQGRIWVESEVGNGSTFFINLPRLSAQKVSEIQAAEGTMAPPAAPST